MKNRLPVTAAVEEKLRELVSSAFGVELISSQRGTPLQTEKRRREITLPPVFWCQELLAIIKTAKVRAKLHNIAAHSSPQRNEKWVDVHPTDPLAQFAW
jgi:hypothetical protein